MIKIIYICIIASILSSCDAFTGAVPSIGLGDKQSNISRSTNNGNGVGRDARVDLALNAGDDKSKQYNDSNLKSSDTNTDNQIDTSQDTTKFSIGGEHTDNSIKSQTSHTRSNTNDDSYSAQNLVINNAEKITSKIFDFINTNIRIFIDMFLFWLGGYITLKRYFRWEKIFNDRTK